MTRIRRLPSLALVILTGLALAAAGILHHSNQARLRSDLSSAEAALTTEQRDRAIAHFRQVLQRDPGNGTAREDLARALDASMVLVPAGQFLMGSDSGSMDERPQRPIFLDAFQIDKHEVTNVQYQRFLLATGHKPPESWPGRYVAFQPARDPAWRGTEYPTGEATYPVVAVNWQDAMAYCTWAGKRLPSEAEWEKAARGIGGQAFPWGNEWDAGRANVGETGLGYPQPVGSYPTGASPHGALDMAGNVWEWVADLYDRTYYTYAPARNPLGPDSGTGERILRGGAWDSPSGQVRASYRNATHFFGPNYRAGFRCARSLEPSPPEP